MIYLDNSATSPLHPLIYTKLNALLSSPLGNPSSLHKLGIESERIITAAKGQVSNLLNCDKDEIIFTSSGSEANNLAIFGAAVTSKRHGNHIITAATEHPSVIQAINKLENDGFKVTYISPRQDMKIYAEDIKNALTDKTILISLMLCNNETGCINDIPAIRKIVDRYKSNAKIHCDCVAAAGKINIDVSELGADFVSISGHKIHALSGTGALYIKKGTRILPMIYGGGQQKNLRSGTENISGIFTLGLACDLEKNYFRENNEKIKSLNVYLRDLIQNSIKNALFISPDDAAAHILNISFPKIPSEVLMRYLEQHDIYISAGAACSAKKGVSETLIAYGVNNQTAKSAVRISFSHMNTTDELDVFVSKLKEIINSFNTNSN